MARKNKLGFIMVLFALLLSVVGWQTTNAKTLTADMANTKSWTRIYFFPSSRADSGRVMPPGTNVTVDYLDRTGDWAYIRNDNHGKGWVRRTSIHFVATENYNQSEAERGQAYSGMTTTTTRWGSLHTDSPYRATPIALAPNTSVILQFSSVDGNWAYVNADKGDGWLPLSQLSIDSLNGLPLWR